jgi:carbohydrate kinase (thermoresistant glucokinase family)
MEARSTPRYAQDTKTSATVEVAAPPTPPRSPPLERPHTISQLISQRAERYPNRPILGYPSSGTEYGEYTFRQLENFSQTAASIYANTLPRRTTSNDKARVVALLGLSNLDYVITTLALSRLGFTVLFLSTRIAVSACESLLHATGCEHIVFDTSFAKTASSVKAKRSLTTIEIVTQAMYSKFQRLDSPDYEIAKEAQQMAWIIHSSGSTGPPKPIYQTHAAALQNYENNMGMRGFITLPLFHAHGLSSVFRAFTSLHKIYMANASLPLTAGNLLHIMQEHKFEIFYGVPYALKLLSETQAGIEALAGCSVVMFGGSACPDSLGDLLVRGGVNLISHYGTTETGQLMTSFRPPGDKAWNYVRVHDKLKPFARFEKQGDSNMYELCILDGWPSKVASNRTDGAYATKDLFEPHPFIAGAWKYSSRLDDTIVLVNGEKAVPIPVEQAVRQHSLVREALMFGQGKSQLGMLIIASEAAKALLSDEILQGVWPIIQEQNGHQPGYAQLSQEMVRVLPADTAYPATDKGTIMRQAGYRQFEAQIDEIYADLEARSVGTQVMSKDELRYFLRREILQLLQCEESSSMDDDTDLFSLGVDSLQSTRLRVRLLKELQFNGNPVPQNVIFDFPSISKLTDALVAIREGGEMVTEDTVSQMRKLVAAYSDFPQHVPIPAGIAPSTVVVTGATGSLGAHLIAQLLHNNAVGKVVALVRAKNDEDAESRVARSMWTRGVWHILSAPAQQKLQCFSADLTSSSLGLQPETYDAIADGLTAVMHCAWSVNFNKQLSSFEKDCIAGTKNLMVLALSAKQPAPATFNFCSSVSTVARFSGTVPATVPDFDAAQPMGYAQSKLVTEHIIRAAAATTGMKARVLRVGQITADTCHGIWNDTEAIPLMLQAATTFGALPQLDETARWLPVDIVASAFADIALSDSNDSVFNIVNPNVFHWTEQLLPALRAAGLTFEEVDQREWLRRLRASDPDPATNPTVKLTDFFASKYENNASRRAAEYEISNVQQLSSALATTPPLASDLVSKFVQHFLKTSWKSQVQLSELRLWIVGGPCGCGKSSVASELAERLGCGWVEGDSVHDALAITKMSIGKALSSIDRHIWLSRLKVEILERVRAQQLLRRNGQGNRNFIVTCSALRHEYRDALRDVLGDGTILSTFIMLQADGSELVSRVSGRVGHYMKASMVDGQLATYEPPRPEERDVFPVCTESRSPQAIAEMVCGLL